MSGWQGRAELVLEGSDTAAISQLAGRLAGLTVARVGYSLSREAREKAEADITAQAIGRMLHDGRDTDLELVLLTTPDGRFTIMMPHPERVFRSVQMSWRPEDLGEHSPWFRMFANARAWLA